MTKALLGVLIPSLVAAVTSLIVCFIAYFQFLKSQQSEQDRFDKRLNRDLTSKLYDLRLEYYPLAFEITDAIYKEKGGLLIPSKMKNTCDELINWKRGIVNLIISIESRDFFFKLRDALMKNPAEGDKYSEVQTENIINLARAFRKQLRRDLGFLYREEKQRRESL